MKRMNEEEWKSGRRRESTERWPAARAVRQGWEEILPENFPTMLDAGGAKLYFTIRLFNLLV